MALLLSWKHSGFSVDNSVTLYPSDAVGLERLARYILRSPVSLERTLFFPDTAQVVSLPKPGHDREAPESLDALEFVARVLVHIPQPGKHSTHYYGRYANRSKSKLPEDEVPPPASSSNGQSHPASPSSLRRRWAQLLRRVYEVDPLICSQCGGALRIVGFITQPRVIRRILDHLKKQPGSTRAPPTPQRQLVV